VFAQVGELDPTRETDRARLEAAETAGPMTADDLAAYADLEVEVQREMADLDDVSLDAWGGWTVDVVNTLTPLTVTVDDLDPALCSVEFTLALLEQWRYVPGPPRGR
jgi:hypothetical protein